MKYDTEVVNRILELYITGDYSIKDICKIVKISQMTFSRWKKEKSEFSESLKEADAVRTDSLRDLGRTGLAKLLNGYEYDEITKEISQVPLKKFDKSTGKYEIQFDEKGNIITKAYPASVKTVKKFIMPSATAVLSTLKNLDPENFPDVAKLDHTSGGKPLNDTNYLLTLSPEELRKVKQEIQAKLQNNG